MRTFAPSRKVTDIRRQIGHPIIDGDGHLFEFSPLVSDYIRKIGGGDVVQRYNKRFTEARYFAEASGPRARSYWTFPEENTLDKMTSIFPKLLYQRMPEIGLDFALLYPTHGLGIPNDPDTELRLVVARAMNTYFAEVFHGYRDRLEPVAIIPMFTPEEAVAELDYAIGTLGLKTAVFGSWIPRTSDHGDVSVSWIDTLGHASAYDYDPVWAKCVELKVAPSFHNLGYNSGTRFSPKNYVFNHLGSFASGQEATCRSLFMGGVPKRFPGLTFSFLEGGVSWACQLLADILGHYDKRNKEAVKSYDPRRIDIDLCAELLTTFGEPSMIAHREDYLSATRALKTAPFNDQYGYDDFAESLVTGPSDIIEIFARQFFFGCEADDPLNALAFKKDFLPDAGRLNAIFASDIGHWDVPQANGVLLEAWELVEHGLITQEDFRRFTFGNVVDLLTRPNPDFFKGTALEGRV